MRRLVLLCGLLAACGEAPPPDPREVAARCADQARAALGPTGSVSVGVNSNTGVSTGVSIGVTGDFLAGRTPEEVYERCWRSRIGGAPTIPLVL